MDTTCDWILGRRVQLEQPRKGFRVAIDTVLLAAAVQAKAGQTALDLGCGVGGAMLALAARVPSIKVSGIEIQPELAELCRCNIERNGMADRAQVIEGDLCNWVNSGGERGAVPSPSWGGLGRGAIRSPSAHNDARTFLFDHVLMNPPYHEASKHDLSPDKSKLRANSEQAGELGQWLAFAAQTLTPDGQLTLIHRADRLEEILAQAASAGLGGGDIIRIRPRENDPPSRVILRLRKSQAARPEDGRNLVLHGKETSYAVEAEEILRHAKSL